MRNSNWKSLAAGSVVLLGVGTAARGQDPGQTARIGRVVAAPEARAAAPDDRPPRPATPGWLAGPTSTAVRPLTGAEQAAASVAPVKKPSLAESTFTGVKSFITPPPGQTTPLPQGMLPPVAQYARQTTPGVYAGPPAYRWYGYGAVTPGRNPHAPDGNSPRGSSNWYVQSGATPGAFPVTVTASGQAAFGQPVAPAELPSYTLGNVAAALDRPTDPPVPATSAPASAPDPGQPLSVTVSAAVEPASLSTPAVSESLPAPLPVFTTSPRTAEPALMPTVTPVPTGTPSVTPPARLSEPPAFAPTVSSAPAPVPAPAGPQPLLTWTSSSTDPAVAFSGSKSSAVASVAAVSLPPAASVTPVAATVAPATPAVVPASAVVPVAPVPPTAVGPTWGAAVKALGRSQEPGDDAAPTLGQAVRNAAYGFATITEVKHTGPTVVVVRLQAATAADARSAAELVSRLPALRAYAVEFLVTVSPTR
jgi:hypothetical protein